MTAKLDYDLTASENAAAIAKRLGSSDTNQEGWHRAIGDLGDQVRLDHAAKQDATDPAEVAKFAARVDLNDATRKRLRQLYIGADHIGWDVESRNSSIESCVEVAIHEKATFKADPNTGNLLSPDSAYATKLVAGVAGFILREVGERFMTAEEEIAGLRSRLAKLERGGT